MNFGTAPQIAPASVEKPALAEENTELRKQLSEAESEIARLRRNNADLLAESDRQRANFVHLMTECDLMQQNMNRFMAFGKKCARLEDQRPQPKQSAPEERPRPSVQAEDHKQQPVVGETALARAKSRIPTLSQRLQA